MELEDFINNNYKDLVRCAKARASTNYGEMLSELYLFLDKKWKLYQNLKNQEVLLICYKFMADSKKWTNSEFSKHTKLSTHISIDETPLNLSYTLNDEVIDVDNETIKTLINDYSSNFNKEQTQKLLMLELVISDLPAHEKVLLEMNVFQNMNHRHIASKTGIPASTVYLMIKKLNEKIKYLIEELDNKQQKHK